MDPAATCSRCHQPTQPTYYFCPNCGRKLRQPPPLTTPAALIKLFLLSALIPPYGIVVGLRYIRQPDNKSKYIGLAAAVTTIIAFSISITITIRTVQHVNEQVQQQLEILQGF